MSTLEVQIGRLKKRITKLQNQREFYKEQLEYYRKVFRESPYIKDRYDRYTSAISEVNTNKVLVRELQTRVFEQSQLIKRLMEEQSAKGNNI